MKETEKNNKDAIIQRGTGWFLFFVGESMTKASKSEIFTVFIKENSYAMRNTDIENYMIKYIKLDKYIEK